MELVGPVANGVEVVAALHQGIHSVVDRNEPDTLLREVEFRQLSHLQVLPSQPAEILDDQGLHLTALDHLHDFFPSGPVEVGPGVSVVRQEQGVLKSIVCRVLLQKQLLRKDLSRVISAERSQIINVKFLQKQGATVFYGNPLSFSNSYRIKFQ